MSPEGDGARREDRTENRRFREEPPMTFLDMSDARYLIETFDRNITPTETFAAR